MTGGRGRAIRIEPGKPGHTHPNHVMDPTNHPTNGSGQGLVFSKYLGVGSGTTGYVHILLPGGFYNASAPNGAGMMNIEINAYEYIAFASGGGPQKIVLGGYCYSGAPNAAWYNYGAYLIGGTLSNYNNITLVAKGTSTNKDQRYGLYLGTAASVWTYTSMHITVRSGYVQPKHLIETPWSVTAGVTSIDASWTSQLACTVTRLT